MTLAENYRSSPEVLELANRLLASTGRPKRLVATQRAAPCRRSHATERSPGTHRTDRVGARSAREGTAPSEIAVLVRMNAQLAPIEAVLTRAGIAYQVRGIRFFDQADVRGAIDLVRGADLEATGTALTAAVRALWADRLGYDDDSVAGHAGEEARGSGAGHASGHPGHAVALGCAGRGGWFSGGPRPATRGGARGLGRRRDLLTYHREGARVGRRRAPRPGGGILPVRQAFDDDELLAEELRLLYVGITGRVATWRSHGPPSARPAGARLAESPSRFLADLRPRPLHGEGRITQHPDRFAADQGARVPRRPRPPRRATASLTTTRCTPRSANGGRSARARTACPRMSCSTTRPLPRSPR